jgi:GNAT superfamily N-acetyltransferase
LVGDPHRDARWHARLDDVLAAPSPSPPALGPLNPADTDGCRLWQACELCIYLEHRLDERPDPRGMTDADIAAWRARGLTAHERLSDPSDMDFYWPYWIIADGRTVGTIALRVQDWGWGLPHLWLASLYLFPDQRRRGHARRLIEMLDAVAGRLGLGALRLETEWTWQPAVRLYLHCGFSVANWKHALSLVRWRDDPPCEVRADGDRMELLLGEPRHCLITARRRGERLGWWEHARPPGLSGDAEPRLRPAPTLALWLAISGWPLIRGDETWEQRYRWSDAGMPEGLAYKITLFEAYTRHLGFAVHTPRIPGLDYPDWDRLQAG